jgi:tetratricopeptide (TPR) repeat protein
LGSNLTAGEMMEIANNYLKNDKYEFAAENYFQAAKQFIKDGKYYKSRNAFIAMSVILEKGIKYYPILLENANSLVMELNNVNVPEISGEILMFCANTAYDMNDIEQSALYFEKAYENYAMSAAFDEYRDTSVACLLKAAYSYYAIGESDKAEKLVLKAVELDHRMDKSILEIESELSELVRRNQFKNASEGYKQLAEILLSEIDSLRNLMKDFKDFDAVAINVKARLIHMGAENLLRATLCSNESPEDGMELLKTTSQLFEQAVSLMYGLINVERVDPEDIQRFGFDFLLAVILKDKVSGNQEAKEFYNQILFEMIDEDLRPTVTKNKYVETAAFVVDNQSHLLLRAVKSLPIGRFEELRETFSDMVKNL